MKEKYLDDLQEIRSIMEQSTRFLSLSGLSGIFAGIFALVGAYIVYSETNYTELVRQGIVPVDSISVTKMLTIAIVVLVLSVSAGIGLSWRKANKAGKSMWSPAAKRLIFHSMIPLIVGGLLILILLSRGYWSIIAGMSLIFYGLALLQASNYTFGQVKYLGILEMILGLLAIQYPGRGLYFWAIGFGLLHILYGSAMYFLYENPKKS